jgi:hypothetical protein
MRRRFSVIALLVLGSAFVVMFGPCAARTLLTDLPVQLRAMRESARREQYASEHPPEPPLSRRQPEVILHAAAARSVRVLRLDPEADSTCGHGDSETCFHGHRVLREIPVQGKAWSEQFLAEVMRMATEHGAEHLTPRFGIRFIGVSDTTDILLDTTDSLRTAVLRFEWKDSTGRPRSTTAHWPFPFEGDPDADSTLVKLMRMPVRI